MMSKTKLSLCIFALLALSGCMTFDWNSASTPPNPSRIDASPTSSMNASQIELEVSELLNEYRTENGKDRLELNQALRYSSRLNSKRLARHGELVHSLTEGRSYFDKLDDIGYNCRIGYENIAYIVRIGVNENNESEMAQDIANSWIESEEHRAAVVDPKMNHHGVGVFVTDDRVYATEHLCDRSGGYNSVVRAHSE